MLRAFFLVCAFAVSGCAYNVQSNIAPATTAISLEGQKVPGKWLVSVRGDTLTASIKPKTYLCSAHSFPYDLQSTFKNSVFETIRNNFDEALFVENYTGNLTKGGAGISGHIEVTAQSFEPSVVFQEGFFSSPADGRVYLSANVLVTNSKGNLAAFSISSERSAQSSGVDCGAGAKALAEAGEKAMRDAMRQIAERLMNDERVRTAGRTF